MGKDENVNVLDSKKEIESSVELEDEDDNDENDGIVTVDDAEGIIKKIK